MKLGKAGPLVNLLMDYFGVAPKTGSVANVLLTCCQRVLFIKLLVCKASILKSPLFTEFFKRSLLSEFLKSPLFSECARQLYSQKSFIYWVSHLAYGLLGCCAKDGYLKPA